MIYHYILCVANLHNDSGQYKVTFDAGVTQVMFDVQITRDNVLNKIEYLQLIINTSLLHSDVVAVYPDKATVVTNTYNNCK